MQTTADWEVAIEKALNSASIRQLAELLKIPKSTIALRRQYPLTISMQELSQLAIAGILEVRITARRP